MDRVNIPGEAPGSATYYMGFAPEEYGTRLYDMDHYGDAVIRKVLMDIGSQRTRPHHVISSAKEYEELVWKSKGKTVYSCQFEVSYKNIDVTVISDFEAKRLTLRVDPAIDQEQRSQLAEFFGILTDPDHYEQEEMEEIEDELQIPGLFRRLAILAGVVLVVTAALDLFNILPGTEKLDRVLNLISWLFLAAYWIWIAVKKQQLKRKRDER